LQERFADPKVIDKELEERFGLKKWLHYYY
jgi:hypothetical protein